MDSLVSLGIAVLMLKSAIDLGKETLSIAEGKVPDVPKYEMGIEKRMLAIQKYRARYWILYLLQEPRTGEELNEIFSGKNAGVIAAHLREPADGRPHRPALCRVPALSH